MPRIADLVVPTPAASREGGRLEGDRRAERFDIAQRKLREAHSKRPDCTYKHPSTEFIPRGIEGLGVASRRSLGASRQSSGWSPPKGSGCPVSHKPELRPPTSPKRSRPFSFGFALSFVVFCHLAVGCTRQSSLSDQAADVQLEVIQLQPEPPAVGEAMLVFLLRDSTGAPVTGATVSLTADMTHAGMIEVVADAEEAGNGLYTTTFEWTMAGDWILTVSGTLEDGRPFRRELQVRVPGEGG